MFVSYVAGDTFFLKYCHFQFELILVAICNKELPFYTSAFCQCSC